MSRRTLFQSLFAIVAIGVGVQEYRNMGFLNTIRASNKELFAAATSSKTPTAIFVGGTSGIGRAMAESLAEHTNGNANIAIVGRNEKAAQEIISSFPSAAAAAVKHDFIKCDVTISMSDIADVAARIKSAYPSGIDYLVLSPGYAALDGRIENAQGIDRKMAVNYYARWKFIHELGPVLNDGAKVVSILGAGHGSKIDVDDFPVKNGYSVARVATVTPTYTDLMMQSFAALYPKQSFTQTNPGPVRTNYLASSNSRVIRWSSPLAIFLTYPISVSAQHSGESMWHGVLNTTVGAHRIGSKGEDIGKKNWVGTEEEAKLLWEHTLEAVNRT